MAELSSKLTAICSDKNTSTNLLIKNIIKTMQSAGYEIAEVNTAKPWGGYIRIDRSGTDSFIAEFFPGLSAQEARLGMEDVELTPKFLIVASGHRLSWQYHDRRAERWRFLTPGSYYRSPTEDPGEPQVANIGDVVQFEKGEYHRLSGLASGFVVVAEIWQHTDPEWPSDEDDITRLQDDYQRSAS